MLHVTVFLSKLTKKLSNPVSSRDSSMKHDIAQFNLEGTIVAPLTPMKPNGDVNYDAFESYAELLSSLGVAGIFVNGSLGEGLSLTVEERCRATEKWVLVAAGRIKHVIVHVGADNLRDAVTLARHAGSAGVDAIASVCSIYFKPQSMDELVEYTRQVAAAAPNLPYFYYDINFMTGVHFDAVEYLDKAKDVIPTLRGLKYTTQKLNVASLCDQIYKGRFQIAVGTNDQCLPYLSVGLGVTITDTTYASMHVQLKKAFDQQDSTSALKYQHQTTAFSHVISKYGPTVPVAKEVVKEMSGIDLGPPRLPMMPLSPDSRQQLMKQLHSIGYFKWIVRKT